MTTTSYLELSYGQVAIGASLILLNGLLSLWLRLGLEKSLLIASVRMSVQLVIVGFVLHWVFALGQWYVVLALGTLMTLIAGVAAVNRTKARFSGVWLSSIVSVWSSSWLVTGFTLLAIVRVEPWYRAQYALPLLGMVLGNTLTGISLGLDRFSSELESRHDEIEALLTLGATRWEAALLAVQEAIRTGMIPTINAMLVTGLVSLPGMMTGQLLSGVDPIEAVKYQLVIMFAIAAGTALGTAGIVLLSYRYRFTPYHQLAVLDRTK